MTTLAGIDIGLPPEIVVPLFVLALLGLSALLARLIRTAAARWFEDAAPALGVPIAAAVVIGGTLLLLPELSLPPRLSKWVTGALDIAFVLACAIGLSRIAVSAVTAYATRHPTVMPALGVARATVRVAIAILALITALESLGVPVAPLLTTLGIGSLAVALALQDTLANFFAGLYLLADRPVRTGDYVKVQEGAEGFVEAIGWRSSRLRTSNNNIVVVPNIKLSQAILTNFHLPVANVTMAVSVTLPHGADADAIERLFLDELDRAVVQVAELRGGKPVVRLAELSEAGQVWRCTVDATDVDAQAIAGHEIRKRLLARLKREGIPLATKERVVLAPEQKETARPS
jgi:small-conductance mechanosensitive channel